MAMSPSLIQYLRVRPRSLFRELIDTDWTCLNLRQKANIATTPNNIPAEASILKILITHLLLFLV